MRRAKTLKPATEPAATLPPPPTIAPGVPMEVKMVLHQELRRDEEQPRKVFDEEKMEALVASIRAIGIRQPLQVEQFPDGHDGKYRIVDGERRWRAAERAGVERVPVMVVDTSSPDWPKVKLAIQLTLNQQHENLTALEEAAAYAKELKEGRHTVETLYQTLGVSRGHLFSRLALNRLPDFAREALIAGKINPSVAGLVAMIPKPEAQKKFLAEVAAEDSEDVYGQPMAALPFRDAQEKLEEEFCQQLKGAPFDVEDAELLPAEWVIAATRRLKGGACSDCPFRSGNLAEYPEAAKRPNVCTQPSCYQQKVTAHWVRAAGLAAEKGQAVLDLATYKRTKKQYVAAEESGYYGGSYTTPKQELGKKAPAVILATTEKGLIPVYDRAAATEAGLKMNRSYTQPTPEQRAKEAAKEAARLKTRERRQKLIQEQAATVGIAITKLNEKEAWALLKDVAGDRMRDDGALAKAMLKAAKTDRDKLLCQFVAGWVRVADWTGDWEKEGLKQWKELGVDLVKLDAEQEAAAKEKKEVLVKVARAEWNVAKKTGAAKKAK